MRPVYVKEKGLFFRDVERSAGGLWRVWLKKTNDLPPFYYKSMGRTYPLEYAEFVKVDVIEGSHKP